MGSKTCIYCSGQIGRGGQGDHIIPASLGEFAGDIRFRCICTQCNNIIGRAEEQILRCGPEALERLALVVPSRRGGPRKSPRLVGAHGMPPPDTVQETPQGPRSLDMIDPGNVEPREEVTILDETGRWHRLRLTPRLGAKSLRQKVRDLSIKDIKQCNLFAPAARYEGYVRLFNEAWPESEVSLCGQEPAGTKWVEASTTFMVSNEYFRAIAKMALHHYLVFSRCALGHEPELSGVREFIMKGGDRWRFFVPVNHFAVAVYRGRKHSHLSHYVAYDESGPQVKAYVWLFVKDQPGTGPYQVEWERPNSTLILPQRVVAHEYRYADSDNEGRWSGRVYDKTVIGLPGHPPLIIV